MHLSPAYDITYSLNPELNFTKVSRALSINKKRTNINLEDILLMADTYTIKNPRSVFESTQDAISIWETNAKNLNLPERVIGNIKREFKVFF